MNKSLHTFLFFIFCLLSFITGRTQTLKEFSKDPDKFFEEMQTFLTETNQDIGEDIMTEFKVIWNTTTLDPKAEAKMYKAANSILKKRMKENFVSHEFEYSANTKRLSDQQKQNIYKTANTMLKKRMKAFPDFKNYLYTLISIQLSNQSDASFSGWQASLDKLLLKSNKYFAGFINVCNNLFADNSLYSSVSTKWVVSNNNYSFDFDSLPKIIFNDLTLSCFAKEDSMVIHDTKGVYYPTQSTWHGVGGIVNWKRAGMDENVAIAELTNYKVNTSTTEYTADSVTFHYTNYFKKPLLGKLTDKLLANVSIENASYPRFDSYTKHISIKNIAKDINYEGGFSLYGAKIIGSGSYEESAHLFFYNKKTKKLFLIASSRSFIVRADKITSDRTEVTFYLDTTDCSPAPHCDSIYHPGLQFKFNVLDRELSLIRTQEGISNSPYFDSFHKVDMYFDEMLWKIEEPLMRIKMISGAGVSKATFESSNYYKDYRFNNIQGLSDVHPFSTIKKFSEKQQSKIVYVSDYAQFVRASAEQVRSLFISLANQGFILYEAGNDRIVIKDRLFYYLKANAGKIDYDVIQMKSLVSSSQDNANINLLNFDMKINGISEIQVSDSQSVFIVPTANQVVLKQNRNFTFSGHINAGRFEFFGKNFSFDYDNFKINLDNVDSMRFKVPGEEFDEYGKRKLVAVKTVVEYINGNLLIDNPTNKSGVKDYPSFPIFNSFKDSYAFYNKSSIQKGVYNKDKFFFHLEPFSIDSLNAFNPVGLGLNGTFVSAGILPELKETLRLQPDYSLGFVRATPTEGYPMYGGKGVYNDTIKMSHAGLRGTGVLNYLSSTTKTNDFIFYPDSMNTLAQLFEIKKQSKAKGIEYPTVKGEGVYIHWTPYKDRMFVFSRQKPIDFYEGQAQLNGSAELAPKGLTGRGNMSFNKGELDAEHFVYKENTFGADTSDFRLKSDEEAAFAFKTIGVKSTIDFIERTGTFQSNGGGSYVAFPINQYICFMDRFKWFMDKKEIEMSVGSSAAKVDTSSDIKLEGSEFISVHPQQDSLRFIAPFAKYNLSDYMIRAEQVKYMYVADAIVYPDSGKVIVGKRAKMSMFTNSKITANSVTKYYNIYNATISVLGRKNYNASGEYDYIDVNKKKQTITFSKITVDTTFQTYAVSDVPDSANFTLIPQIHYKGKVALTASKEHLNFDGYGMLNFKCSKLDRAWFKFAADIDPNDVYIPVSSEPRNDRNEKLAAAISLITDSVTDIRTNFLSERKNYGVTEMLPADGFLYYDKSNNEYKISTKEKLQNKTLPGNYLNINDTKCISYGEGKVNFGASLGQIKLTSVGNITHNLNTDSNKIDMLLALNFFFNDDALKEMGDNILSNQSLPVANNGRATYEKGLAEMLGKEKSDKLIAELNLYGAFKKMPPELLNSLFLSEVHIRWNPETKSYRSVGPIGLGSILKLQINKQLQGHVEIIKKRNGDVLNVYLEADKNTWYFFSYTKGTMQTISSDAKFNKAISEVKSENRKVKAEGKQESYEYILSTERKKNDFIKRIGTLETSE